jgi:signal transduction histidine kinase
MTKERWHSLFRQVLQRVRSLEATLPRGSELGDLARELELLNASYEEDMNQVVHDAKRQMADLEELHHVSRLANVGTLTIGIAHELGTPLGVVLARAQMIVTDEIDIAEARRDAEEIIVQVKRMTQMCREVLDYARPKAPARLAVDLVQLVRQMLVLLHRDALRLGAKLVLADDPPPSLVLGDSSKLMQIFTNLTINAAQAMPAGGIVTLRVESKRLQPPAVEGLPEAEYVCVHVQDTGTGIRSADLQHIFDTFFTTKKADEGTGLGLAVSHRIAREHDGWIGVVTEEGRGSTFTVYLPRLTDEAV